MTKRILAGKIATAHGVKGLVKLFVYLDNTALLSGPVFISETGEDTLTLTLKNATAKHWLAEVEGIHDRTEAEKLRGTALYISRDSLPPLEDGEHYHADLIGLPVFDDKNHEVGKVIDVVNFGAGDLLDIQPEAGNSFYAPYALATVTEDLKIIVSGIEDYQA